MVPASVIPASVIVVSRHRSAELLRCLTGLRQQDHPAFEVIVVADPEAVSAVAAQGIATKRVEFDASNISAARNAGLAVASAPIVAFIDDDAVAEPTWLSRLTGPFGDDRVVASTGYVRGRNGISFQWRACEVDRFGNDHPLEVPETGAVLGGTAARAVKTQGTNCAFRRTSLLAIGGFDPAYRFYLDEADVNLRLAPLGRTAIVPLAQVHHVYAASERRRADRVPLSLHEVAASTAVFLRRHAPDAALSAGQSALQAQQTTRINTLLNARRIGPDHARGLTTSLSEGWDDGMDRALGPMVSLPTPVAPFMPLLATGPRKGTLIAGRIWQRQSLLQRAGAASGDGLIVTVLCFAPTPRAHSVGFTPEGFWLQEGGLFGRTERSGPRLRLVSFARRCAEEARRIAATRPVD